VQNFKKLLFLLSSNERKQAGLLLVMISIMAFLDMIGVASILPFITVLTNPNLIETNLVLNYMFQISNVFGVENNQQFLFSLGILVFVVLVISLIFKTLTTYVQVRFVQMREQSIGKRLMKGYLHQPYSWFLSQNSAELGKNILSEVGRVIGSGMSPAMEIIAKGAVVIAITILLIIADPKLALIVALVLGGSYSIFFYIMRSYIIRIGSEGLKNNKLRFLAISEAFGATKEVKVDGLEKVYVDRFSHPAKNFARTQTASSIIATIPRNIFEIIAFGGIILLILYIMAKTGNFNNALPIISLYVFAGYRMMPALQKIYASFTKMTFVSPTLDKISEDFKKLRSFDKNDNQEILPFNKKITLKNIHYIYPNASRTALKDISLTIPAKSSVGLVGHTGCGKTTTVDIILGLLEAQKGTLQVDEKIITKINSRSWQKSVSYVPQHIYLSDDTIASNIAFGNNPKDIDHEAVEKFSKIANLHDFVSNELPKQYQTIIGERGVRLSGGQRQRIGIARALYNNPKVLVLDEATNALDGETEDAVMDAINNLSKDLTVILIAHRLKTVKSCDIIFKFEKGQLIAQGTYDEIIGSIN
jgi:ABC-type multidrug transport system fused ATPase/permease subunit